MGGSWDGGVCVSDAGLCTCPSSPACFCKSGHDYIYLQRTSVWCSCAWLQTFRGLLSGAAVLDYRHSEDFCLVQLCLTTDIQRTSVWCSCAWLQTFRGLLSGAAVLDYRHSEDFCLVQLCLTTDIQRTSVRCSWCCCCCWLLLYSAILKQTHYARMWFCMSD